MTTHGSTLTSLLSSLPGETNGSSRTHRGSLLSSGASDKNGASRRFLQVPVRHSAAHMKAFTTQSFAQLLESLRTKYDSLERRCNDLGSENDRLKRDRHKATLGSFSSLKSAECTDSTSLRISNEHSEIDLDDFCAMRARLRNSDLSLSPTTSDMPNSVFGKHKGASEIEDTQMANTIRFSCVESVEQCYFDEAATQETPGQRTEWMRYSAVEKKKILAARSTSAAGSTALRKSGYSTNFAAITTIVENSYFDTCCAFLLISNAVLIGIQVDYKSKHQTTKLPAGVLVVDYIYAVWFLIELFLRMSAFGCRVFFCGREKKWNLFDFLVVGVGTIETVLTMFIEDGGGVLSNISAVRSIRAVRVVRILRVIRLMRFFRSLRILVAAIFNTVKSCMWTATLLGMIIYIVGITFTQAVTDHFLHEDAAFIANSPETDLLRKYFGSLPRSIFTCLKSILGGIDWEVPVQSLSDLGWAYVSFFVFQIVFIYLAVMNVISGLFLQCALEHAQQDKDDMITHQLQEREKYNQRLLALFREIDKDRDGNVTLEDFEASLNDTRMLAFLEAMDIQANDAWTLFKLIDREGGGCVNLECFVDGCFELKGGAKTIHIAQLVYDTRWMMEGISELTSLIERCCAEVSNISQNSNETTATMASSGSIR